MGTKRLIDLSISIEVNLPVPVTSISSPAIRGSSRLSVRYPKSDSRMGDAQCFDALTKAKADAMVFDMRTTLTIEDQLMHELKEVAHRRRKPLKTVVNETLRQGLKQLHQPAAPKKYKSPTFSLGHPLTINPDKALTIASALEDGEISRKLTVRK